MPDTPASEQHARRITSDGPGAAAPRNAPASGRSTSMQMATVSDATTSLMATESAKLARLAYETELQRTMSLAVAWLDARTTGPVIGRLDDQLTASIIRADDLEAAMLEAERQA